MNLTANSDYPDGIVWRPTPEQLTRSRLGQFMSELDCHDLDSLWERSVHEPEWFWAQVASFLGIEFDPAPTTVLDLHRGPAWPRWFVGGGINLAQLGGDRWAQTHPDRTALIGVREDPNHTPTSYSFAELADQVARLSGGLAELGVEKGDAVAVFLPMSAQAVIAMLAIVRMGAIFVPIFSGFGTEAVSSRLEDPLPKVVITADGSFRRGQLIKMKEVCDQALVDHPDIGKVVVVDYAGRADTPYQAGRDHSWTELITTAQPIAPAPTQAEDPLMIAYTSGTTGKPKGTVHTHGGFALKVAMEGAFQVDIRPGDASMWVTDMGWVMGPWMVTAALVNGAAVVTYDGAPDYPGPDRLWDLVERNRLSFLGVSPTLIRVLQAHGNEQADGYDLTSLRTIGSTGEPWNPDPWWWLFREVGKEKIPIVNLSGGTEIGACILSVYLPDGIKPVSVGRPSLGIAADVFDPEGNSVVTSGEKGELVITKPWPGITRGFWGDTQRYLDTYWSRYPGVWTHGDWATVDPDGFWFLHGRSDDTLNIAGKRIGPAEVESVVVELAEIIAAAAVGIPDPLKGMTVAIFAVPNPHITHSDGLTQIISDKVATTLGKGFRPSRVVLVDDLPRTRSAKIMRRVIRALALGEDPGDLSSLENPASLQNFSPLSELTKQAS